MAMNIAAIAFDLDGTLVDCADLHKVALNSALIACGLPAITDQDHVSRFNGLPTRKKLEALGYEPELIERINSDKQARTLDLVKKHIRPDATKISMLQRLADRYELGVATNSMRDTTEEILYRAGIREFFTAVVTNEDVRDPKPHPEIYRKVSIELDVNTNRLLVVEDNRYGQRAALKACCRLCPVSDPSAVTLTWVLRMIEEHNKALHADIG